MPEDPSVNDEQPTKREWASFWSLVGMQTTNAFNDNFAKFILIPLGVALASQKAVFEGIEYLFGLLTVLPFILFAPTAGWLGDRFSKSVIIRWSSWMQLFVLLLMGGALALHSLPLLLFSFFLLTTQSALLSPSKMGVVKELVGSRRLGFANGVMEGTVILAILSGQIIGGLSFDQWGRQAGKGVWESAMVPILWVLIGAGISLVLSHMIHKTKAHGVEKYHRALACRHFRDLKRLKKDAPLWRCTLGIAFFWGFGGFLQFLLIQIAAEKTGGDLGMGVETALLWVPVVVGIVLGSALASWICKRRNELGLVVFGGVIMTVATLFLAMSLTSNFFLGLAGFGSALFLVPLNAYFQDRVPEGERGLLLSASNLCTNLFGVLAMGLQFLLKTIGIPPFVQYLFVALLCGVATVYIMRLLPRDFVRLLILGVFRSIYKVRVQGLENIPEKGGVLLVANHLTYIDGLVLSSACPRSIRFLMFADCFERKWLGKAVRFFDTVPISPKRAKDAIRVASEALKEGAVVCIFPEGQLSRTGGLSALQRGYQMIARKAGAPILPAYMDGLWGSIFSFSGGNFLKKRPKSVRYGVSVAFGETLDPKDDLLGSLTRLSALTVEDREPAFRKSQSTEPQLLSDLPYGWSEMKEKAWATDARGCQLRINALQLSQVNIASRESRLLVEVAQDQDESIILGILWPIAIHAPVALIDQGSADEAILALVSRERLNHVVLCHVRNRKHLIQKLRQKNVTIWSVDGEAEGVYPLHVNQGRIVSYTLPHPDYETTTQLPQLGTKPDTIGRILPGSYLSEKGVEGPAYPNPVTGLTLDEDSFLGPAKSLDEDSLSCDREMS